MQRFPKSIVLGLHLGLLLLAFVVSVFVRMPNFNQPLGRHHEWITAHTLLTLKIWEHGGGPENYYFSPVYIFEGEQNKNIGILGGVSDKKRDFYYVSYPPFAFILPYYALKVVGAPMSVASIQVFGFALHLFTALVFYLLLLTVFNRKFREGVFLPAVIGYLFYLFSAGNLWFHSNVYFVDVLIQFFVFVQLLLFLKIRKSEFGNKKWHWILFFAVNFIAIYTEWLGLFVAFVFGLITVVKWISDRQIKWVISGILLLLSAGFSLGLTVYQYSSISGFDNLYNVSVTKYELRSGYSGEEGSEHGFSMSNPESYKNLRVHNDRNYRFTLQALIVVGVLSLCIAFYRKRWFTADQYFILAVLLAGIILHLLLFFNFNAVHDFSTLKSGTFFILLLSFSSAVVIDFVQSFGRNVKIISTAVLSVFLFSKLLGNYNHYMDENSPLNLNYYSSNVGKAIYQYAKEDEMVFVDSWILPECMYYAERNYHSKSSIKDALGLMREWNVRKGLFIYTKASDAPVDIYRIFIEGDSIQVKY
ncbi:MAG: hypothetical protein ACK40M_05880 [Flavobacteriales bacterium]